jgi:Uma2 family endonuclease
MYLTITRDSVNLPAGGEVILRHQTWSDYEDLLKSRQDRAAIKIYFDAEAQEIRLMSPLPGHGKKSDTLSDLVKCLLRYQEQDWESFDPITLKRFEQKGLEPDACFYIQNRTAILQKERIDLAVDPPPDLAIEVDLTSSTRPEDYQEIGVPELWIYRSDMLYIYQFNGQQYNERSSSSLFCKIPVQELIPQYVKLAWESGSSIALRAFEDHLRTLQ